jgi:hypothetical protein
MKLELKADIYHIQPQTRTRKVHINNITLKLRYKNINTNFITAIRRTTMRTIFKEGSNRLHDLDPKPGNKLIITWSLCAMFLKLSTEKMANAFHIMFKHRKDKVGSQTYCLCRNTSI